MKDLDLTLTEAVPQLLKKFRRVVRSLEAEIHWTDTGEPFAVFFDPMADFEAPTSSLSRYGDAWVYHCNHTDTAVAAARTLRELVAEADPVEIAAALRRARDGLADKAKGDRSAPVQTAGRQEPLLVRGHH